MLLCICFYFQLSAFSSKKSHFASSKLFTAAHFHNKMNCRGEGVSREEEANRVGSTVNKQGDDHSWDPEKMMTNRPDVFQLDEMGVNLIFLVRAGVRGWKEAHLGGYLKKSSWKLWLRAILNVNLDGIRESYQFSSFVFHHFTANVTLNPIQSFLCHTES